MRISVKIKQADDLERILARKFSRFLMQRADQFIILRRRAVDVRARRRCRVARAPCSVMVVCVCVRARVCVYVCV